MFFENVFSNFISFIFNKVLVCVLKNENCVWCFLNKKCIREKLIL